MGADFIAPVCLYHLDFAFFGRAQWNCLTWRLPDKVFDLWRLAVSFTGRCFKGLRLVPHCSYFGSSMSLPLIFSHNSCFVIIREFVEASSRPCLHLFLPLFSSLIFVQWHHLELDLPSVLDYLEDHCPSLESYPTLYQCWDCLGEYSLRDGFSCNCEC